MKAPCIIFLLVIWIAFSLDAQDTGRKSKKYITWVTQDIEPHRIRGELVQVNDQSIIIRVYNPNRGETYPSDTIELFSKHIQSIKRRKKHGPAIGAIAGLLSGFVVGGIIGLASGDTEPVNAGLIYVPEVTAEEKALVNGISLGVAGSIVGALFGLARKGYTIDGKEENFEFFRKSLKDYAIIK